MEIEGSAHATNMDRLKVLFEESKGKIQRRRGNIGEALLLSMSRIRSGDSIGFCDSNRNWRGKGDSPSPVALLSAHFSSGQSRPVVCRESISTY